jgi:hypothetical protein
LLVSCFPAYLQQYPAALEIDTLESKLYDIHNSKSYAIISCISSQS